MYSCVSVCDLTSPSRWTLFFYRLKESNKMQLYADIYLLLNHSTCFGRPSRPSSGEHKTVAAASGTDHTIWEANFPDSMICTRGCNYSFMYS